MMQILLLLATVIGQAGETSAPKIGILEFSASWCGPCKAMKPAIDELLQKGYPISVVDGDENPELVKRYKIEAYPTLVLIDQSNGDAEIARTSAKRSANEISDWFVEQRARVKAKADTEPADARGPPTDYPDPLKSAVRIRVFGKQTGSGYTTSNGSGTIVYSGADQSIILTCAHIFGEYEKGRPVEVDLFDGIPHGTAKQAHKTETVNASKLIFDPKMDLGVVWIKPGKTLPLNRIAFPDYMPALEDPMTVVGCRHAQDPNAFKCKVQIPFTTGPNNLSKEYRAVQCSAAASQGRSGGGLFNEQGYLVGVLNFCSGFTHGEKGWSLYAHPQTIRDYLDKNSLSWLYKPNMTTEATPKVVPEKAEVLAESAEPDGDSRIRQLVEETCRLFHRKQPQTGPPGADGATGPQGPPGPQGPAGPAGTGTGTPVDLTAILKRLAAAEQKIEALNEEALKPWLLKIKLPGGRTVEHKVRPKPNTDGEIGIGANFPEKSVGVDMSRFAVLSEAPSAK